MYRSFREQSTAGSGQCEHHGNNFGNFCTSEQYSEVLLTKNKLFSPSGSPSQLILQHSLKCLPEKLKSPHFEHKSGGVHAGPT